MTGNREEVCKIRGIKLNYSASQTVNFDVIRVLVLRETVTIHTERKIKCKRANIRSPKTSFIGSFLKRRLLCDNTSVPFGYV